MDYITVIIAVLERFLVLLALYWFNILLRSKNIN